MAVRPGGGDPRSRHAGPVDETLETLDFDSISAGDIVGIGIHTGNALRGYEVGGAARAAGATVIYGGIHATLYPEEARDSGRRHAVVIGDGDVVWARCLGLPSGASQPLYDGGRVEGDDVRAGAMGPAARGQLHVGVGADGARLPEALLVLLGVAHRRPAAAQAQRRRGRRRRFVELRRKGFRFIALADDNFYPVALKDLRMAARARQPGAPRRAEGDARRTLRADGGGWRSCRRTWCSSRRSRWRPPRIPEFLDAMNRAHIKGALVGVESVTPEGLKDVYKDFNVAGDALVARLRTFRKHGVHVLGSFIFGLPSDSPRPSTRPRRSPNAPTSRSRSS